MSSWTLLQPKQTDAFLTDGNRGPRWEEGEEEVVNRDPGGFGPWSWLVAFLESAGTFRRVSDTDGDREDQERRPRELASNIQKETYWSTAGKPLLFSIQQHASSARLAMASASDG